MALIGNCVATVVVAAWERDLDRTKATQVLDGGELVGCDSGLVKRAAVAGWRRHRVDPLVAGRPEI